MPSERVAATVRRRRRSAAPVALLLGAALLGLSVPQLIAAVLSLEARAVQWQLEDGKVPPVPERIANAAAGLAAATGWVGHGQPTIDRSFLLLRQGDAAQAEAAVAAGLARSPGQPSAWARLARLRLARGDREGAALALRLSLLSGAVVPALMSWRLDLGLQLRPILDADTFALVERQVRLTWILDPDHVATLAGRTEDGAVVRQALDALSQVDMQQRQRLRR